LLCTPGTRLYGLIGSPIRHSLSPLIHCALYRRHGVDAVYLAWETGLDELGKRVEALRSLARGFNVTTPLKEKIIELLDELSREAREIGAVNTIDNRGGKLIGYNTDYLGVTRCLEGHEPEVALVIGAGGAARAVVYALRELGAKKLLIANRGAERAKRLAEWANRLGIEAEALPLTRAHEAARQADTIVNATPLGSQACCPEEAPPVLSALDSDKLVFDLVYKPVKTRLLREAEKRGAKIVTGLCMLIWQALYADKIWLGITPSREDYTYIEKLVTEKLD